MCVLKLHDDIIDIKCLNDNSFYLVSIGKGINGKAVNNHTTFINSNFVCSEQGPQQQHQGNPNKPAMPTRSSNTLSHSENSNYSGATFAVGKNMNRSEFGNKERNKNDNDIGNSNISGSDSGNGNNSNTVLLNNNAQEEQEHANDRSRNISKVSSTEFVRSKDKKGCNNVTSKQNNEKKWEKGNVKYDICKEGNRSNNYDDDDDDDNDNDNANEDEKKRSLNRIDMFLNIHVFKKKQSYFKSRFFYFDSSNITFFKKNKKLQSHLTDLVCICVWDLCSIMTNEEKSYLQNKNMIAHHNSNSSRYESSKYNYNILELTKNEMNKGNSKKLKGTVLHPTLVCVISNLPKNKTQVSKNKNMENNNYATSFCTWLSSTNYLYKSINPFDDKSEKMRQGTTKKKNKQKKKKKSNTVITSESSKRKNIFWNLFKNKQYSYNFSEDAYIFYGDQLGYIHIVHLQMYKEVYSFKAFDIPIFKIFITKNFITKLLILTDGRLRIYEVVSAFEIFLIKEIEIKHDMPPKKCICAEKINELKEKRKKEENENEGISIFNLSYFLSSNYKKQSNTRNDDKMNTSNNSYSNSRGVPTEYTSNCNLLNDNSSTHNVSVIVDSNNNNISNTSKENKMREKNGNVKEDILLYKHSNSNSSYNSVNNFKTISESEDADVNSDDRDAYQSVIIGGINFGYLGFNFSKFMNNKKKTTIIDAYLLSNSHLVIISSNGTITLIKI
ncbi:conserved Plasmodium protein, unknown function [Plasmodium malariae]|nr:conserved Plasmodium protein, unknown function [Plasmodium malariae]